MGRFVSQDPKGFGAGDTNLYRYTQNAPTNNVDTSGEDDKRKRPTQVPDLSEPAQTQTGTHSLPTGGVNNDPDPPGGRNSPYYQGGSFRQVPSRKTVVPGKAPNGSHPGPDVVINPDGSGSPGKYRTRTSKDWVFFAEGCDQPGARLRPQQGQGQQQQGPQQGQGPPQGQGQTGRSSGRPPVQVIGPVVPQRTIRS